ncbi:putative zinc finger protein [Talaromyces proteolyticus]|uniref:Zinc finger protein n=1 Tax=Talaromyces proteolyticus TaxID=1131652 RepID=A0AAD4L0V2_9EURO|nr:putative zinc finger protein [Talaromyces proteolyticus]KAH8705513.1 putative zinc finger protein [Talaromyces proteolyticus]
MPQERIEKGKRVRACSICGRTFKRTEHCIRHERAHFHERPFSCRFCDKSYGRKDLLVRHERTLHTEQWTNAQTAASASSQSRPARRRQSRSSWAPATPVVPPPIQHYKPESQQGMRINNETVIQYESFLPSPRVSSSSEISDPEPVSGVSEGFDFDLPLDPNLLHSMNMVSGPAGEHMPHHLLPAYSMDPHHLPYEPHMQPQDLDQFNCDHGFPLDPSLTMDIPKADSMPTLSFDAVPINLNFFSLFPKSSLDNHTSFTNQVGAPDSLVAQPPSDIFVLNPPPPEPRRRGRPSRNAKTRNESQSRKAITEETRTLLQADLQQRLARNADDIEIPTLQSLQRFMNQFFKSFNNHLPIFHVPSFDISATPSPLLLAMCSIGALFHLERDSAYRLRALANEALQNIDTAPNRSLWEVQCKLLLVVGAAFGGDCSAVAWALENVGFFHREFSCRRSMLLATQDTPPGSWADWVERESSKRLLFGMFIVSSLLTISYNVSPAISTTDDLKIEMPEDEYVWAAADEERWKEAMATTAKTGMDVNQALTQLLFGKDFSPDSDVHWPAFAVTILMHAVNVHMWHVTQSTQSFMNFSVDTKAEEQMKALCTNQTEESLARCHKILEQRNLLEGGNPWGGAERPLLFNGMALLRSCYVRAFTRSGTFNRSILFSDNEEEIFRSAKYYVQTQQVRTPFLTKAVAQVFDGLLTSIREGPEFVKKTASFTYSIEHAIAVWDCALFYTKWVHTVEMERAFAPPDHEERKNLDNLVEILREVDNGVKDHSSLAASVARLWASFLDDTWTWEVTWRMGKVLRKLADVYEHEKNVLDTRV